MLMKQKIFSQPPKPMPKRIPRPEALKFWLACVDEANKEIYSFARQ